METLSEGDRDVLNTIFDPLQPFGSFGFPKESETVDDDLEDEYLESHIVEIVKKAIACAEMKNFDESFQFFNLALTEKPRSPSILNDRAQALRLVNRDEDIITQMGSLEALKDLNLAVELSEGKGRAGVQALCQRGALYRYMEKNDQAKEDFRRAAMAGSKFAKAQLVALNPYAAMCNAMLREITCKSGHA